MLCLQLCTTAGLHTACSCVVVLGGCLVSGFDVRSWGHCNSSSSQLVRPVPVGSGELVATKCDGREGAQPLQSMLWPINGRACQQILLRLV